MIVKKRKTNSIWLHFTLALLVLLIALGSIHNSFLSEINEEQKKEYNLFKKNIYSIKDFYLKNRFNSNLEYKEMLLLEACKKIDYSFYIKKFFLIEEDKIISILEYNELMDLKYKNFDSVIREYSYLFNNK